MRSRNLCLSLSLFVAPLLLLSPPQAEAASPEEDKGLAIAQKVDKANEGYKSDVADMQLVLVNAHGDKTVREMSSEVVETDKDGDKSRIEFIKPADVKGTRMLTWTHKKGDDDQWLYMPAIKRVKRISSSNKSGSFMASEFSYEDLSSQEVEKFTYKFLGEQNAKGRKLWHLQRIPVDSRSGYSKQLVWIDQGYMNAVKIEYYDRKGEKLKTADFSEFKKYGKLWRVGRIDVKNHQTRKSSSLVWKDRKLGEGVPASHFANDELGD